MRTTATLLAALAVAACGRATTADVPAPLAARGAPPHTVVPVPASIEFARSDSFEVTPSTAIFVQPGDPETARIGGFLAELLATRPDSVPPVLPARDPLPPGSIHLALDPGRAGLGEEGYELSVTPDRVSIVAREGAGLFYGVQTFRQLLPPAVEYEAALPRPIRAPAVRITDRPRYAWRGAMLDVARHFREVDEIKRYVDLMAMYKLNRLHLHLSDDQGWRIEIPSWPNLALYGGRTEVGGGEGGYYTREQYADIVRYAGDRFVTVVPEIDMPGHTNAALASYPELNCDGRVPTPYTGIQVGFSTLCVESDSTYAFVDDVVREIGALTPGPYFHIGGDEVEKLTDEQYRAFIERAQEIVRSHGKRMIGWGEIAPADLHRTSIIQLWRPDSTSQREIARAVAEKGVQLILSPADRVYLDMKYDTATVLGLNWAAYIDVRDAYAWDPATFLVGAPQGAVLGVEAPLWSETLATMHDVEYLAFPRLAAVAELGWSPAEARDWEEFRLRLGGQGPRWSALGVNFYRSPQVPWQR